MKLHTAQYKYAGDDRLDITVKGIGTFRPDTWKNLGLNIWENGFNA